MSVRTESENEFERYLDGQGIAWSRVPETDQRQPDYSVQQDGTTCVFEVKEFDDPRNPPVDGFDPCPPVREKIHCSRRKFGEYKSHPCAVVLWSSKSIFRDLGLGAVLSAAFGRYIDLGGSFDCDRAKPLRFKLHGGEAALTQWANTTISAIIILTRYQLDRLRLKVSQELDAMRARGERVGPDAEDQVLSRLSRDHPADRSYDGTVRAIVVHNPHARVAFPSGLFNGPFDQQWSEVAGFFTVDFMGSELSRLRQDGCPFVLL